MLNLSENLTLYDQSICRSAWYLVCYPSRPVSTPWHMVQGMPSHHINLCECRLNIFWSCVKYRLSVECRVWHSNEWHIIRPLGYEIVYLPLCKVADTPFYTLDMKGCICHFAKWQIHRFIPWIWKGVSATLQSGRYTISFLGYERVYLPLCKVADAPFHIQG